jgi:hypothetical protein
LKFSSSDKLSGIQATTTVWQLNKVNSTAYSNWTFALYSDYSSFVFDGNGI